MLSFFKKIFASAPAVDYKPLIKAGAIVIDVRTPEEFRMGHVKGSVNIPLQVFSSRIADLKKKKKVIIAICRTGRRSGIAANMLHHAGVEAYNGGGWKSFQKSIEN